MWPVTLSIFVYKERDWDRERIELLTEENARLEFEKKTSMNESASLEQELEDARAKVGSELTTSLCVYYFVAIVLSFIIDNCTQGYEFIHRIKTHVCILRHRSVYRLKT